MRIRIRKTDKSEMTYNEAVALVALNESPGDPEAFQLDHVASLVGVSLVADVFGITPEKFAKAIIKFRKKELK